MNSKQDLSIFKKTTGQGTFSNLFFALMFIRIIESKTDNKISVETLIDILKDYNFQHFEGNGYVPTYTRNEMTDLLHDRLISEQIIR